MSTTGSVVDAGHPTVTLNVTVYNPNGMYYVQLSGPGAGGAHCDYGVSSCQFVVGGWTVNTAATYTVSIESSSATATVTNRGYGPISLRQTSAGVLVASTQYPVGSEGSDDAIAIRSLGTVVNNSATCTLMDQCTLIVTGHQAQYIAYIYYIQQGYYGIPSATVASNKVWAPSGAAEDSGNPSTDDACNPCHGDPISTVNGTLIETATDVTVGGRGLPLTMARTYRSDSSSGGDVGAPLGAKWAFTYGMTLTADPVSYTGSGGTHTPPALTAATVVDVTQEDGSTVAFSLAGGVYTAPTIMHATLVHNANGTFTFTRRGALNFIFSDTSGQLQSTSDHDGLTTTLAYSGGLLSTATGASGRMLTFAHNPNGTISSVTDPLGHAVTYGYSSSGMLASVTDRDNRVTTYNYGTATNGQGALLSSIVDPRLGTTSNTYDSYNEVTSQTTPAGRTTTYAYDGNGNVTITDADNHVTKEAYTNGQRTSVTVGYGTSAAATTTYAYDPTGGPSSVTDPLGHVTSAVYNALGQKTSSTDANNHTTTYTYNNFYQPLVTTLPSGLAITNAYSTSGDLTSTTWTHTGSTRQVVYYYANATYPHDLTSIKDKNYQITTLNYDTAGDLNYVKDPASKITTAAYNANGWKTSSVDPIGNNSTPTGHTTTYTYDNSGDPLSTTDPLGHATSKTYDGNRNVATSTDGLGHTTTYTYNADDQLTSTLLPDATTTIGEAYDPAGYPASSTDGNGHVTNYGLDPTGRVAIVTDPLNHTTTTGFDLAGRVISVTDPNNHATTYAYDNANQQTSVTDANTHQTRTSYNVDGLVATITDANLQITTYGYDALDQLRSKTDPNSRVTAYNYDNNGHLTTLTSPDSLVTTIGYDIAGKLTSTTYSDGLTHAVTYTYDADARRATMIDGSGTTTYTHDAAGRLTSSTDGAGHTTGYTYDNANRLTTLTYPGTRGAVTYTYNTLDQVTGVTDWASHTTTVAYDHDGAPITLTYPNGIAATYGYDTAERLTGITDKLASTTLASFAYTYDPASQLTSDTTVLAGNTTTSGFGYDNATQLTSAPAGTDVLDPAGQLTSSPTIGTLAYDHTDQLTTITKAAAVTGYGFNARGDRTTITPPTPAPVTTLAYDQADQLAKISTPTATTATYGYDGDGMLTSATTSAGTVKPTWDAASSLPSLLDDGHTTYVYGPTGVIEQADDTTGAISYLHTDQLGSTRLITSPTATVIGTYTYSPYGVTTAHTGTATTSLQYAGQYTDAATGYQYLRARWYDPTTAQFLTRDPLEAVTGTPYSYAGNNPITNTDPTGNDITSTLVGWGNSPVGRFIGKYDPAVGAETSGYNFSSDLGHHCWHQAFIDGGKTVVWTAATVAAATGLAALPDAAAGLAARIASRRAAVEFPEFSGTAKPWTRGATPNSRYTQYDAKGGFPKQKAIYDGDGNVVGHVDYKQHGSAPPGHGHTFPEPGNPASGHGPGSWHIPPNQLPPGW